MLHGHQQAGCLDRLEQELENLRAALEWSQGTEGGAESILRLVSATGEFWQWRFYRREGADWLRRALQEAGGEPTPLRAKALFWADMRHGQAGGAPEETLPLLRESVAIYRQLGDKRGLIIPLAELARVTRSDSESALALHEESVALAREVGDKHRLGCALWAISFTLIDRADWGRVEAVLQKLPRLQQERGSPMGIATAFRQLGRVAIRQGEYARARDFFMESLARTRLVGDVDGVAIALSYLAELALREGDLAQARSFCEERLTLGRIMGHAEHAVGAMAGLATVALAQGDHEGAQALLEESLALDAGADSEIHMGCGHLLLELGDFAAARSRYEEGLALRREGGKAPVLIAWALLEVGHAAWLQGEHDITQSRAVEALGLFQELNLKDGMLAALESLGMAALAEGRKACAARLMGAAEALREALALHGPEWWHRPRERIAEAVRAACLEREYAAAWAEGRAMSLEEAVKQGRQA